MIELKQVCVDGLVYGGCQHDTARARRCRSMHGAQQQTRRTPLLRWNDVTDGRTDSGTFDRRCSTYCATTASANGRHAA